MREKKGNFPLAECNELSGKYFSHTPLGAWVQVFCCGGQLGMATSGVLEEGFFFCACCIRFNLLPMI